MRFDMNKYMGKMALSWSVALLTNEGDLEYREFDLVGPRGCGKTALAQEFVRANADAFYLSFEDRSEQEALEAFRQMYLPQCAHFHSWEEAAAAFARSRQGRRTLLVFENETTPVMRACCEAFREHIFGEGFIRACCLTDPDHWVDICRNTDIMMRYPTIADYRKLFPNYGKQEIVRLHALTGGIPSVAKELDPDADYEQNVRKLLDRDSAFSMHLPQWMTASFRNPESYYPILKSIAGGYHRLSEIARDIGFPNNKCGKYIEALIEQGIVIPERTASGKQSTYFLANSYFDAWARYVYQRGQMQVAAPDMLYRSVCEDIDETLAIPAFRAACLRYIEEAAKEYLLYFRTSKILKTEKAVPVKLRDGSSVILDQYVETEDADFVFVFPRSLNVKYTKDEIGRIYEAVDRHASIYNTHVTVFSLERFSDWCVHEAKKNRWFHAVTYERLKY